MKVIYYTRPCFLDLAISYAGELAKLVELHLVIEISPENWQNCLFDVSKKDLKDGVVDGAGFFKNSYPQLFDNYLIYCASITLIVHNCPKSIHPATLRVCLLAMNFCRKLEPDIIHFDDISLRTALGVWRLKGFPLVFSIHDPVPHSGEKNWRRLLARKLSFPFVDRFLLHSAIMQETFLKNYPRVIPSKTTHTYLAVYDIFRQWIDAPRQDNGKTVLFFGRLSPYKGVDVLLQAAPLIAQKIKDVCIVIAGRPVAGYTVPALPDLANGGKFEILDTYIDNSRLADLFQRATVVACPYLDATQSGVVLTAYAFNKPVVATEVGGLPEYIWHGQTGFLVAPGEHQQLAAALIRVITNPEIQFEMKSGIYEIKKKVLNWRNTAVKNLSVYADLLAERSRIDQPKEDQ